MAKELIPFKEDENLIVGKYYNVNCAIISYLFNEKKVIKKVPVIGFFHSDKEIGTLHKHIHIDGRFTKGKSITGDNFDTNASGISNKAVNADNTLVITRFEGFIVTKKKCKRLTTGTNPPSHYLNDGTQTKWFIWQKTMLGKSCAGRKCPHYGTHMLERDGRLVCPLHNLQGDIKTEKIIEAVEFLK